MITVCWLGLHNYPKNRWGYKHETCSNCEHVRLKCQIKACDKPLGIGECCVCHKKLCQYHEKIGQDSYWTWCPKHDPYKKRGGFN